MRKTTTERGRDSLTRARVLEILRYDPLTGDFFYVNSRFASRNGTRAGSIRSTGYVYLVIDGIQCLAHRVAWLVMTGAWPREQIDHADGCRTNNRFANLRDVSSAANRQNQRHCHGRNASGLLGVSWSKSHKKWRASITAEGTAHHLGYFDDKHQAHDAYRVAKASLHPFQTLAAQGECL